MAKTKQTIVKPEKVLRDGLQDKKFRYEADGWTFDRNPGTSWIAIKGETRIENPFLDKIFLEIEGLKTNSEFPADAAEVPVAIEISRIIPSPFEPQARRRAKFADKDIEELGNSILKQGLFSPIVVRPVTVKNKIENLTDPTAFYEIVFGERRFLAVKKKGLPEIRCFIRDLSDAEVLEMQYQENHQRASNDPLDDAFTFAYLRDHENYSVEKLADRFGTSKAEVTKKLKLNDLIPEAVEEFIAGDLPLRHAYYLARFPAATQKIIVEEQMAYNFGDKDDGAQTYAEFKEEVEKKIVRNLETAPFDRADSRLHIKGLICADCTERTGYEPLLFGGELGKNDSCLNKSCFEIKTNTQLRLKREEIAMKLPGLKPGITLDKAVLKVPLVTEKSWSDSSENPWNETPLKSQKILPAKECDYATAALAVDGEKKGQEVFICNNENCEIHHAKKRAAGESEAVPEWRLKENERDLQKKINNELRRRVFAAGINWFDENKKFWQFKDLVERLLTEFLFAPGYDTDGFIRKILKGWDGLPEKFNDREKIAEFVRELNHRQISQLLFLLAYKDEFFTIWQFENKPEQIAEIKAVTHGFTNLDYNLLDAEIRFELAPDEFKDQAADYLAQVKNGIPCEPPYFWFDLSAAGNKEDE